MQCLAFKGLGVTPQMCPDSSCFNLKNVLKTDRPQVVDSCDSKSIFILYIIIYMDGHTVGSNFAEHLQC